MFSRSPAGSSASRTRSAMVSSMRSACRYKYTPLPAHVTLGGIYGEPMTSVKQIQVAFDCAEPERVARFWCEVLGYVVPPPPEGFATWADYDRALPPEDQGSWFACIDPSGAGPRLYFQRVPEGKVVKNRL